MSTSYVVASTAGELICFNDYDAAELVRAMEAAGGIPRWFVQLLKRAAVKRLHDEGGVGYAQLELLESLPGLGPGLVAAIKRRLHAG